MQLNIFKGSIKARGVIPVVVTIVVVLVIILVIFFLYVV
jgi:hypothetical protein